MLAPQQKAYESLKITNTEIDSRVNLMPNGGDNKWPDKNQITERIEYND